ncbi:MAG TPA: PHP domain-containing protein, partial [Acidobacteriaceae bacterium]
VVEADELSVPAILNGIRRGRVFIDLTSSHDKLLDMEAGVGSRHAQMGEDLTASDGMSVQLNVHVAGCTGDQVHLLVDGHESPELAPLEISGSDETLHAHWMASSGRHWLRAEIRDSHGTLLVLGNPIYINFQTR